MKNCTEIAEKMVEKRKELKSYKMDAEFKQAVSKEKELIGEDYKKLEIKFNEKTNHMHVSFNEEGSNMQSFIGEEGVFVSSGNEIIQLPNEEKEKFINSIAPASLDDLSDVATHIEEMDVQTNEEKTTIFYDNSLHSSAFIEQLKAKIIKKDPNSVLNKLVYKIVLDKNYNVIEIETTMNIKLSVNDEAIDSCIYVKVTLSDYNKYEELSIPQDIIERAVTF